jgi:hypothetical protein
MFIKKIELIGLGILFVVNAFYSYYLAVDVFNHKSVEKGNTLFMLILYFSLAFLFTSSIFITITLNNLHATYSKSKSHIKMSPENKKKYEQFKLFFMICVVFIGALTLIFFLQPPEYSFFRLFYGEKKYMLLSLLWFFLKSGMTATVLGMSAYLVYLSNDLSQMTNTAIH